MWRRLQRRRPKRRWRGWYRLLRLLPSSSHPDLRLSLCCIHLQRTSIWCLLAVNFKAVKILASKKCTTTIKCLNIILVKMLMLDMRSSHIGSNSWVFKHHKGNARRTKQFFNQCCKTFFFKNGPVPASFCLFLIFSRYNFNNTNWKKCRWCAWDSNPGPQDGRRRWNHGAMAATSKLFINRLELYGSVSSSN